jgi:hypothetical protein
MGKRGWAFETPSSFVAWLGATDKPDELCFYVSADDASWTLADFKDHLDTLCTALDALSGVTAELCAAYATALQKRARVASGTGGSYWTLFTTRG